MSSKADDKGDDLDWSLPSGAALSRKDHLKKIKHLESEVIPNLPDISRERVLSHLGDIGKKKNKNKKRGQRDSLLPVQERALQRRKGDRRTLAKVAKLESRSLQNAVLAADAELLLNTEDAGMLEAEHEMEDTLRFTQKELKHGNHLSEVNARQIFDLSLKHYGPYSMKYDRSGKTGVLYGQQGHVALMNCQNLSLECEFHLNNNSQEKIRDATFLHNDTLFALAQKKNVFIYDNKGAEIHMLKEHQDPLALQFLPYHWLLASTGRAGYLTYHDTSTGSLVSQHRTRLGPCDVLRQNPQNAVLHLGHSNGQVSLYSPAMSEPLVKIHAHYGGPVRDLAVDHTGKYMATAGADSKVKIWDLRTYKHLHTYTCMFAPPTTIDISQRGVLGIGHGTHTTFWSPSIFNSTSHKLKKPYMSHTTAPHVVQSLRFRPFEDVCGVGTADGYSSLVVPGSGEPNLDSLEYNANPYQDATQRREAEVRSLLDKLAPNTIALDPDTVIGTVEDDSTERIADNRRREDEANQKLGETKKKKKKMRGRGKIGKQIAQKHHNVVDAGVVKRKEQREREKNNKDVDDESGEDEEAARKREAPAALKRFF